MKPIFPTHDDHPAPTHMGAPPITEWKGDVYEETRPYEYENPREGYADYYAAITALDDQFGRLMDTLEAEALAEDTIVIYTSDHGGMLWSQGRNQKSSPYEESIRIPFIVRWPGNIPEERTPESLLSTVDFVPTLLGLAGVEEAQERERDGIDLSDLALGNEETDGLDSVFLHNLFDGWWGVRTKEYTYARVSDTRFTNLSEGQWLLYDNLNDPLQRDNLVYDQAFEDVIHELEGCLSKYLRLTNDPQVEFEEYLRRQNLIEKWNKKERHRHPDDPALF